MCAGLALLATIAGAADSASGEGARPDRDAWCLRPVREPQVPRVGNETWPAKPEDRFILAALERQGLRPAAPADERTWLRRVSFALTGLPPSREAIQELAANPGGEARERVVDGLLASPGYGEHWARHWMDLVRYAESRGHESDYPIANAWQYRDYLLRALNADVPYDRFLREHIAGDLLSPPRVHPATDANESVLGTGWAFLGEEVHSPVDIRQDECDRIDNKVDVFTKTFLGLTVSCARCHDHKFDPIRAQDYYALTGFILSSSYRQVRFEAMENNRRAADELIALRREFRPRLAAAWAAEIKRALPHAKLQEYLAAARVVLGMDVAKRNQKLEELTRGGSLQLRRLQAWVEQLGHAAEMREGPLRLLASALSDPDTDGAAGFSAWRRRTVEQSPASLPPAAVVIVDFDDASRQPWKSDGEAFGRWPTVKGELLPGTSLGQPLAGVSTHGSARRDPFWNRLRTAPGNEQDSGALAATARAGQMVRTPTFTLTSGRLHYLIRGKTRVYAAVDSHLMIDGPLHGVLLQRFDTTRSSEPQWVSHDLSAYVGHRAHIEFGPEGDAELEILMVVESADRPAFRPVSAFEPDPRVASWSEYVLSFERSLIEVCTELASGAIGDQPGLGARAALGNWLVQSSALFVEPGPGEFASLAASFFERQEAVAGRVQWESHTAVAWFDGNGVDEHVLEKGKPFRPGAVAPRALPAAFSSSGPIQLKSSSGRLELGQQLVDPSNPLVARVIVNRVWHHLFGRGIVATVDNFGALGEPPSHPDLLDYLAWQFMHRQHWSLKHLIRELVLTQTFAMDSKITDQKQEELDPANVLLHRGNVRRLQAESIRDALLAVSGRLELRLGGPPVPVHLTEFVIGRGRPEQSGSLDGDGRRSIYTAVRRNFLPTAMLAFDSPTPFSTVGKRNVTNVPGQSLTLMNDPLFHQQARVWAERMLRETPGSPPQERIRWLVESAYGRQPTTTDLGACLATLFELQDLNGASREPEDLEAWASLCHALLNANDFIFLK